MTNKIDWNDPDLDLDEVLGVPDIDKEEGFRQENRDKVEDIINLDNIEEVEKKLKIKININKEEKKITFEDNDGYEIGRIEPGIFNMYKYEDKLHLYKKIDESYRGKGYGTILMNLYKKYFELPKTEVSYKISTIRFLQNFGYNLEYKIINGEILPITDEEKNEILYGEVHSDELPSIYKLVLEE